MTISKKIIHSTIASQNSDLLKSKSLLAIQTISSVMPSLDKREINNKKIVDFDVLKSDQQKYYDQQQSINTKDKKFHKSRLNPISRTNSYNRREGISSFDYSVVKPTEKPETPQTQPTTQHDPVLGSNSRRTLSLESDNFSKKDKSIGIEKQGREAMRRQLDLKKQLQEYHEGNSGGDLGYSDDDNADLRQVSSVYSCPTNPISGIKSSLLKDGTRILTFRSHEDSGIILTILNSDEVITETIMPNEETSVIMNKINKFSDRGFVTYQDGIYSFSVQGLPMKLSIENGRVVFSSSANNYAPDTPLLCSLGNATSHIQSSVSSVKVNSTGLYRTNLTTSSPDYEETFPLLTSKTLITTTTTKASTSFSQALTSDKFSSSSTQASTSLFQDSSSSFDQVSNTTQQNTTEVSSGDTSSSTSSNSLGFAIPTPAPEIIKIQVDPTTTSVVEIFKDHDCYSFSLNTTKGEEKKFRIDNQTFENFFNATKQFLSQNEVVHRNFFDFLVSNLDESGKPDVLCKFKGGQLKDQDFDQFKQNITQILDLNQNSANNQTQKQFYEQLEKLKLNLDQEKKIDTPPLEHWVPVTVIASVIAVCIIVYCHDIYEKKKSEAVKSPSALASNANGNKDKILSAPNNFPSGSSVGVVVFGSSSPTEPKIAPLSPIAPRVASPFPQELTAFSPYPPETQYATEITSPFPQELPAFSPYPPETQYVPVYHQESSIAPLSPIAPRAVPEIASPFPQESPDFSPYPLSSQYASVYPQESSIAPLSPITPRAVPEIASPFPQESPDFSPYPLSSQYVPVYHQESSIAPLSPIAPRAVPEIASPFPQESPDFSPYPLSSQYASVYPQESSIAPLSPIAPRVLALPKTNTDNYNNYYKNLENKNFSSNTISNKKC